MRQKQKKRGNYSPFPLVIVFYMFCHTYYIVLNRHEYNRVE